MRIEALEKAEKGTNRYTVRFEDGAEIKVSAVQIADFGLYSGREMADDEYAELLEALQQNASRSRAMRILSSRSISSREMEKRLVSRGDSAETARDTLEWLEGAGLLNDEQLAESIVRYYSSKGFGPAKIKNELFRRGIQREQLENAMENRTTDETAVNDLIAKKLQGSRDEAEIKKVTAYLYKRGFRYEDAHLAVSRFLEEIDD